MVQTWNVLEKENEIRAIFTGHEDKLSNGKLFIHPVTSQPHLFVEIENFADDEAAVFLVPMQMSLKS